MYLGAQIPIGFNLIQSKSATDGSSITNKNNQFVIGAGVFFGFQVFIADLPFAIGIETGYSGTASFSGGKRTITTANGETTTTLHYDKPGGGTTNIDVDKSSFMKGHWGADAAITFTYYFRK